MTMPSSEFDTNQQIRDHCGDSIITEEDEEYQKQWEMMGRTARAVRFGQYEEIHDIPESDALTAKEALDVWYNEDDFEYFFNQCRAAAERLEKKEKKIMLLSLAKRGIDGMTKSGLERTKQLRSSAIGLVLAEQDAQWDREVDNSDGIAALYKAQSAHANMVALMKGLLIEKEVQTMHKREAKAVEAEASSKASKTSKSKKSKKKSKSITSTSSETSKAKKSQTKKTTKKKRKSAKNADEVEFTGTVDGQTSMTVSFTPTYDLEENDNDDCLSPTSHHEKPPSALTIASGLSELSGRRPSDVSMASLKSFASCSTDSTHSLSTFDSPEVTSRKKLATKKSSAGVSSGKKSKSSSHNRTSTRNKKKSSTKDRVGSFLLCTPPSSPKASKSKKKKSSSAKESSSPKRRSSTSTSKKQSSPSASPKSKKSLLPFRSPGRKKQGLLVRQRVDYYENRRTVAIDTTELDSISFHQLCEQF